MLTLSSLTRLSLLGGSFSFLLTGCIVLPEENSAPYKTAAYSRPGITTQQVIYRPNPIPQVVYSIHQDKKAPHKQAREPVTQIIHIQNSASVQVDTTPRTELSSTSGAHNAKPGTPSASNTVSDATPREEQRPSADSTPNTSAPTQAAPNHALEGETTHVPITQPEHSEVKGTSELSGGSLVSNSTENQAHPTPEEAPSYQETASEESMEQTLADHQNHSDNAVESQTEISMPSHSNNLGHSSLEETQYDRDVTPIGVASESESSTEQALIENVNIQETQEERSPVTLEEAPLSPLVEKAQETDTQEES